MRFLSLYVLMLIFVCPVNGSDGPITNQPLTDWEKRNIGFTLDPDIKRLLLAPDNVERLVFISNLSFASAWSPSKPPSDQTGWDLLAFKAELGGSFGFEAIYHGVFVARKRTADPDWSKCELFYYNTNRPLDKLVRMTDDEMRKHLIPARNNQLLPGQLSR